MEAHMLFHVTNKLVFRVLLYPDSLLNKVFVMCQILHVRCCSLDPSALYTFHQKLYESY